MRVAAIYDIHGNLPALEAVIEDVRRQGVNQIVIGGDVVPGPMPRETLACLLELDIPVQFIQGNGEVAVLAQRAGTDSGVPAQFRESVRWNAKQLEAEEEQLLTAWPDTVRLEIGGLGEVFFCHATPRSKTEIFIRTTPQERVLPAFAGVGQPMVICGHTHMQFDRTIGNLRVINAGSAGMPFGKPGAYWLLLAGDVELRRTPYDLASAAQRIQETNYPQANEFAARNVLQPPTEAQMLEAFAKVELR